MRHPRRIQTLIRILPFRSCWSDKLRQHLESCQKCHEDVASMEEARTATISMEEFEKGTDFWPELARRLKREISQKQAGRPRRGWRWAMGTAGLVAAAAIALFFLHPGEKNDPAAGIKLRINYVRMYEEPARAFFFKTQDANRTFVWVEKQESGEVL